MCDHFSFNKITIFGHIAPHKFLNIFIKFDLEKWKLGKILYPCNAVFPFENRHFLTHRPPDKMKAGRAQRGKFFEYIIDFGRKIFVPLQTLFSHLKIAIFWRIAPQIKWKLGARSAENVFWMHHWFWFSVSLHKILDKLRLRQNVLMLFRDRYHRSFFCKIPSVSHFLEKNINNAFY